MPFVRLLASALMWTTVATPVFADVTLRMRMTETGAGGLDRVSDMTEYRKGLKVRTDMSGPQTTSGSTIEDLETGRSLMLWHAGKVADVFDLAQLQAARPKEDVADVKLSIVRTAESRQIAGETCTVHTFTALTRTVMRQESVAFRMEGSACLVPNGPGLADFTSYARAAAKIGHSKREPPGAAPSSRFVTRYPSRQGCCSSRGDACTLRRAPEHVKARRIG
jgi:hypothetical protein